ncbi:MAG: 4-vinyl reductase [bacterium]|nr:4-vinyl reductase [bacterium]
MKIGLTLENMGDIKEGRPTLGTETPVLIYRLLQFSLREIIEGELGDGKGGEYLYRAGQLAGRLIYDNFLAKIKDVNELYAQLADLLYKLKVCILRVEKSEPEKGLFVFVATEDLDCSGVPEIGWPICQYDEGIIAGILSKFTGKNIVAKEIDCWATGERYCRIEAKVV